MQIRCMARQIAPHVGRKTRYPERMRRTLSDVSERLTHHDTGLITARSKYPSVWESVTNRSLKILQWEYAVLEPPAQTAKLFQAWLTDP